MEAAFLSSKKMALYYLLFIHVVETEGHSFSPNSYNGKTVKGVLGSTVNFTWTFSGYFTMVDWGLAVNSKNFGTPPQLLVSLLKSGPMPVALPAAYIGRVSGKLTGSQVTFTLRNVRKGDGRLYGCQVRDTENADDTPSFNSVNFTVESPPVITVISSNTTVNEGEAVTLTCAAGGYPPANITWTKDNKVVNFPLNNIRREEAGLYRCTVDNGVGNPATADVFITVQYAASVNRVKPLTSQSWIRQTVALTCEAKGVPKPTITWIKPDGTEIKKVGAVEHTVNVLMITDQDFGIYTCKASNGVGTAAAKTGQVQQIKTPGSPIVAVKIRATSISVSWTEPADNGGSPITAYRVLILQGNNEIRNENITDLSTIEEDIGGLNKSTNYTVRVFARNYVFEGNASERKIRTKFEGAPTAAEIIDLPDETNKTEITLKWKEAENNGAPITKYTVYQRIVRDDGTPLEWTKIREIKDYQTTAAVKLEKGKAYEFVVTATNNFDEGVKEDGKIKRIKVLGGVPSPVDFTHKVKDDKIEFKWEEPNNNGANITLYTVYYGTESEKITDVSKRTYVVKIVKGKAYKVVVTASNKYGESSMEGKIQQVNVSRVPITEKPTESQTASSYGDEKKTLHAVYITIICLLLIGNLVLIFVLWRTRSRLENLKKNERNCPRFGDFIAMNPISVKVATETDAQSSQHNATRMFEASTSAPAASADYMPLHPSTRSWEINREQVTIVKVIGKGAFSQVAQATVSNMHGRKENITVAVKMLKGNAPASDRKDLQSELELMKKLKPHPHVINLLGCITKSEPLLVFIEYVPYGDLLGYLRKSRGLNDTYFKNPDVKPQTSLTADQLMNFTWQVADGMCYLSSKKIIHRDLAARNVLVGEEEKCKVTDFGMARDVHQEDIYNRTSRGRLPVKWTAYESLMYGTYTTQSDVWSYGVLLYEILTVGGTPYPDIKPRQIAERLQEGYRMPRPKHVETKLYQIMLNCWKKNPLDRPTFDSLRKTVEEMQRNHQTYVNLKQYDHSLYANINDLTAM